MTSSTYSHSKISRFLARESLYHEKGARFRYRYDGRLLEIACTPLNTWSTMTVTSDDISATLKLSIAEIYKYTAFLHVLRRLLYHFSGAKEREPRAAKRMKIDP